MAKDKKKYPTTTAKRKNRRRVGLKAYRTAQERSRARTPGEEPPRIEDIARLSPQRQATECLITKDVLSSHFCVDVEHDHCYTRHSMGEDSTLEQIELPDIQQEEIIGTEENATVVVEEQTLPELEICNTTSKTDEIQLEGRRIVDIAHLFKEIVNFGKHTPFDCTFIDMYPVKEQRMGLNTTITFKCRVCNITQSLRLCDDSADNKNGDPNKGLVLGSLSSGSGYSGSETLFTTLNIPFMAPSTYIKHENSVADAFHSVAWKTIEAAGKEEAELAKSLGEVDKKGTPMITVIADGAWSKRSYSVNYDAKSGVACIVGARTKKMLFLGIRNKYCCVCSRAESKKLATPEHTCYKNWSSTSTSMESDIIVEGFKKSMELHGVIFKRLVGDGDSSVYSKLLEARPYGNVLVEKVECTNHLLRNFSKKMRDISDQQGR